MGGFTERASIYGLMGLVIRGSSCRECVMDRALGNQPLPKLIHTLANTKRTKRMDTAGTNGPTDAFTKVNSSMMLSTSLHIQAWRGSYHLSRWQVNQRSLEGRSTGIKLGASSGRSRVETSAEDISTVGCNLHVPFSEEAVGVI